MALLVYNLTLSPISLPGGIVLPPSSSLGTRGPAFNATSKFKQYTVEQNDLVQSLIGTSLDVVWSGEPEYVAALVLQPSHSSPSVEAPELSAFPLSACDPDLASRDSVYVKSNGGLGKSNSSYAPGGINKTAIGFVFSVSDTAVAVISKGELAGFSNLVPGTIYYGGREGTIITLEDLDNSELNEGLDFHQALGIAKSSTVLDVNVSLSPIVSGDQA